MAQIAPSAERLNDHGIEQHAVDEDAVTSSVDCHGLVVGTVSAFGAGGKVVFALPGLRALWNHFRHDAFWKWGPVCRVLCLFATVAARQNVRSLSCVNSHGTRADGTYGTHHAARLCH
jgi:hypothetical protein